MARRCEGRSHPLGGAGLRVAWVGRCQGRNVGRGVSPGREARSRGYVFLRGVFSRGATSGRVDGVWTRVRASVDNMWTTLWIITSLKFLSVLHVVEVELPTWHYLKTKHYI